MRVSIVVPVLNEGSRVSDCLANIVQPVHEVVVVDGGSSDDTAERAAIAGAQVIRSARGRSIQMNAGAQACSGEVLLFLHADTRLPPAGIAALLQALSVGSRQWGRFDVQLDSKRRLIHWVGAMMNARSRVTGIATGDQAMFLTRSAWHQIGGFPPIELMEDIELSKRLKRAVGPPICLRERVLVSARRWEQKGVWRTIVLMWWLRLQYFFGASPQSLHRQYYGPRPPVGPSP